jgi:hypothetical protein
MSTQIDQLFAAYKVTFNNIQACVQKQVEFIDESARGLKGQAVRAATPLESQGLQGLSSGLWNSDKIEALRALMSQELVSLLDVIDARYKASVGNFSK